MGGGGRRKLSPQKDRGSGTHAKVSPDRTQAQWPGRVQSGQQFHVGCEGVNPQETGSEVLPGPARQGLVWMTRRKLATLNEDTAPGRVRIQSRQEGRAENRALLPTTGVGVWGRPNQERGWQRGRKSEGHESGARNICHRSTFNTGEK